MQNTWMIFLLMGFGLSIFLFITISILMSRFAKKGILYKFVCFIVALADLPLFLSIIPDRYLKTKPSENWSQAGTAVVLGFGYEKQGNHIKPGKANEALLAWTLSQKKITTILVQEGVWVAVEPLKEQKALRDIELIDIK